MNTFLKLLFGFFLILLPAASHADAGGKRVAIVQFIEHPALDEVRREVERALKEYRNHKKINLEVSYFNAQGNIATTSQIAQQVSGLAPDVVVAIGTPVAQSLLKSLKGTRIPLVFAAITDPVAAGLIEKEAPHPDVTGVTDTPALKDHGALMKRMMPALKTLGIVYNPGEANSVATVQRLKEELTDIRILDIPVTKSSELLTTVKALLSGVDGLYVPQDNIVVAAMPHLAALAVSRKVPVFAADTGSVQNGALATKSFSYSDIGSLAGEKVIKILEGTPAGELAVESPSVGKIMVNRETAEKLGIILSPDLIKESRLVPDAEETP